MRPKGTRGITKKDSKEGLLLRGGVVLNALRKSDRDRIRRGLEESKRQVGGRKLRIETVSYGGEMEGGDSGKGH